MEIYAAQLSQSFFSCLAISIEGFLDLFLVNPPPENKQYGLDEGSINTDTGSLKDLPAGALASIVLWCDSELSKFSNSFGGARILGMLPLSPPRNLIIFGEFSPKNLRGILLFVPALSLNFYFK